MRHFALLALIATLGCTSPTPWRAPDRSAPWDIRPLDWLLIHQNGDGSWGEESATVEGLPMGKIGVTTFTLNALIGYGYTQLSKDERHGCQVGPAIQRSVDWLIGLQRPDGSFKNAVGDFEDFLAAEFLLSNYSMTADRAVRARAKAALASVTSKLKPDGSWGSPECTFMAMAVLESARMAEDVDYDKKALEEVLRLLDEEFNSSPNRYNAVAPYIRHYRGPDKLRRRSLDWVMRHLPGPSSSDFIGMYFGSILVYGVSMNPDPEWLTWTQSMEEFVEATVAKDGSCRGPSKNSTIVRTAIAGLCHVAYRGSRKFEPVFGQK